MRRSRELRSVPLAPIAFQTRLDQDQVPTFTPMPLAFLQVLLACGALRLICGLGRPCEPVILGALRSSRNRRNVVPFFLLNT